MPLRPPGISRPIAPPISGAELGAHAGTHAAAGTDPVSGIENAFDARSGFRVLPLELVSGLTVTPQGTTGATTWGYRVSARSKTGITQPCAAVSIINGNAILDASNFNRLTWNPGEHAVDYVVYRTTAGGTPNTTGRIAIVTATTFDDTGVSIAGSTIPPDRNQRGCDVYISRNVGIANPYSGDYPGPVNDPYAPVDFFWDETHRRPHFRSVTLTEVGDTPEIALRRTGGTYPDGPLGATIADECIGLIHWTGYTGSGGFPHRSAQIYARAAVAPTATNKAGNLYFAVTANNEVVPSDRLAILNTGCVGVGVSVPIERLTVGGHTIPNTDNAFNCGDATHRWALVRGVVITSGDLGFEETSCPICGKTFKDGDVLVLLVKAIHDWGTLTIPIHDTCKGVKKTLTFQMPEMVDEHYLAPDGTVQKHKVPKTVKTKKQHHHLKPGYFLDKTTGKFKKHEVLDLEPGVETVSDREGKVKYIKHGKEVPKEKTVFVKEPEKEVAKEEATFTEEVEHDEIVYCTVTVTT